MAAACGFHSVVAFAEGDLFTWGAAENGRLGHNDEQDWQMVGCCGCGESEALARTGRQRQEAGADAAGARGGVLAGHSCTRAHGCLRVSYKGTKMLVVTEEVVVCMFGLGGDGKLGRKVQKGQVIHFPCCLRAGNSRKSSDSACLHKHKTTPSPPHSLDPRVGGKRAENVSPVWR